MAKYFILSKALVLLCLTNLVLTPARSHHCSPLQAPKELASKFIYDPLTLSIASTPLQASKELASKFIYDPLTLSIASTDYGNIVHKTPLAVFAPSSTSDISELIKFSNSLPIPFTIAARGQAHSAYGQAMAHDGIVVNMTELNQSRNGARIIVSNEKSYVDVGGEQMWIDVLYATLEHGLTPLSWTDYLLTSVGGTLSHAGISGHTFHVGPQITNIHELDVITGKGDLVTCSAKKNSNLFYAVLGGLGQFGIITRARIALGPAPTRARWLRLLYTDFSAFSRDQEHLISFNGRNEINAANFVDGWLMLNPTPLDLFFYPECDKSRITSLVTQHGIIYVLELAKYYDNITQDHIDQDVEFLVRGLKFVPTFIFEKDVKYEDFLTRYSFNQPIALHPWLDLFVPGSRIKDFDEGVFKGIILKQNLSIGLGLVYPMNKMKWDEKMSAVTPDEEIFYVVDLLHISGFDQLEAYVAQNQQILQFCADAGIGIKQYLPRNKTLEEWEEQFGPKWNVFVERKHQFDPKRILSPGQQIFN